MSEEITLEQLNLKKPLDKMTAKELRELVIEKIPQITGASGMDKDQLVATIKELFGIVDEEGAVSPYKKQILSLKASLKALREDKAGLSKETPRKDREIIRRKINKIKKRTRRLARAS
ncbi:hypothetical protein [Desulfovibrio inopinatus]|uniref:hypothetical protein n=1 Tax=Desulfovibrio inopinatus TaxID=102109 RepID=UPI000414AF86|nr:hypothetical protein [Desulfovibrio inopinatus]